MQTAIDQESCWMQMYHCLTLFFTQKAAMTDYICHWEGGFLVRLILHGAQPFPFSFSTSPCLYMVLAKHDLTIHFILTCAIQELKGFYVGNVKRRRASMAC